MTGLFAGTALLCGVLFAALLQQSEAAMPAWSMPAGMTVQQRVFQA